MMAQQLRLHQSRGARPRCTRALRAVAPRVRVARASQTAAASVQQPHDSRSTHAAAFLASLRVGGPPAAAGGAHDHVAQENVELLLSIQSTQRTAALLESHPELLAVRLTPWLEFLAAYGVSEHFFFRLLGTHPDVFTRGSLFNAGQTMVFLQSLGLTTRDISAHIIPKAPEVLLQDFTRRLEPVTGYLLAPPAPDGGDATTGSSAPDPSTSTSAVSSSGGELWPPAKEASSVWCPDDDQQQQWQEQGCQEPAQRPWGGAAHASDSANAGLEGHFVDSGRRGGLGLSHEQLRSLLSRCPRVLLMSVERDLQPRVTYLRDTMAFTAEQVRRLVTLNSSLLLEPLEPLLTSHLAVLTRACGFTAPQARWLLVACPECLALTTGNLDRKFRFLHGTVFGPATQQAALRVPAPPAAPQQAASPSLAMPAPPPPPSPLPGGSSSSGGDAGQQEQGGGAGEGGAEGAAMARAAVLVYPAALNHSLLNEIGPRFSYVMDRGKIHHVLAYNELSRRVTLSLSRLLDADTDAFLARVAGEPHDFASFSSRWRRTQAGNLLTVTPTGTSSSSSSTGSSWSNEASW